MLPDTGKSVWQGSSHDHLDPLWDGHNALPDYRDLRRFRDSYDWSRGNGTAFDSRDNFVALSLLHRDVVVKLSVESGEIIWLLGEPTGWGRSRASA